MALVRSDKNYKKNQAKESLGNEYETKKSAGDDILDSKKSNDAQQQNDKTRESAYDGRKQKYGYHLSPEEQDIAYDFRANMMHRLENQNNNLQGELGVHQNAKALRRKQQQQPYACRIATGNGISQRNMKLLMKSYEKKAKEAEDRINQLEKELDESHALTKRYHDMYISEKERSLKTGQESARNESKPTPRLQSCNKTEKKADGQTDTGKKGGPSKQGALSHDQKTGVLETLTEPDKCTKINNEKITEEGLDDDEALFKRHIARIADTKSMRVTSPIRVQDVIRKNEVLLQENEAQKLEIQRLKWDNSQLVKKVKLASADRDKLLHMISTSEAARKELVKRLEKEIAKNHKLQKSLTRQAADWIQVKKTLQEMDDKRKLAMLFSVSPNEIDVQERTYNHPVKKNVYMPRYMFPVEQYAQANKSTGV